MAYRLPLLMLGVVACGRSDEPTFDAQDVATAEATSDAQAEATRDEHSQQTDDSNAARPYLLASAGARLSLAPRPGIGLTSADLATDVDVVVIHQEFYGLPWEAFAAGNQPPHEWVVAMDRIAQEAASVGPAVLALQLVSGDGRQFLADRTVVTDGVIRTEKAWSARCYDFASAPDRATLRAAYLAYVDYMVREFRPRWVNVAIELNMFATCPESAWNALVEVERAAYDRAKAAAPDARVFASFQLEYLYGYASCPSGDRDVCYDQAYARLEAVKRDRFAVTTFPYLVPTLRDPAAIPPDWLTRAGDRGGERTIVAETGWLGTPLIAAAPSCVTGIASDEAAQLAWFDKVMASADRLELITWVANRDLVPAGFMTDCPCDEDEAWCDLLDGVRQAAGDDPNDRASAEYALKQFGAMGIRHYDGTPRAELLAHWQAARERPPAPE